MPVFIYVIPAGLVAAGALIAWVVSQLDTGSAARTARRRAAPPLAHELPYWDVSEDGVMVGVDLTYSATLELVGVDTDCRDDADLEQVSRSLHSMLQVLPSGVFLQMLHVTDGNHRELLAAFTAQARTDNMLGALSTRERCELLAADPALRRSRLHLVVSRPPPSRSRLPGKRPSFPVHTQDAHLERRRDILTLRDQVARGLQGAGLGARPLGRSETTALVFEALNPQRATAVAPPSLGPTLPFGETQTLRERLCYAGVSEDRRDLRLDGQRMRCLTLKSLPSFTAPALLEALTVQLPFSCTVSAGVELLDDQRALETLKRKRDRAGALATFGQKRNQEAEAQHHEMVELIDENLHASIRMVRVSLTVVLSVPDDEAADAILTEQTGEVLRLLAGMNGADGLIEDYAQLDSWLSTLPGNATHAGRWLTCTSSNASHLLLAWQSWPGHAHAPILIENARAYPVALNPFDPDLDNPNAFMAGASGAGKSVTTNFFLMHLLASGASALIIDVGGSYRRLIELYGGEYISFERELDPSINLFYKPLEMRASDGSLDPARLQFIMTVLEALLADHHRPQLRNEERAVLDLAIQRLYADAVTVPTLSRFISVLRAGTFGDEEDEEIAARLAKRLEYWTRGAFGRLLDRPSTVQLTSSCAGFDLKGLPAEVREAVVLILSGIIWNLVTADPNARKIVVFDEVWTLLSTPASAKLIEELYRTSRKYRCAILSISQSVDDFAGSSIATALINNSASAYLLRHRLGHDAIGELFHLNARERYVFEGLEMRRGEYSELLVMSGSHHFVARIALTPLEYWIATTHPADKAALLGVQAEHPHLNLLDVLRLCARRWPRGAEAMASLSAAA